MPAEHFLVWLDVGDDAVDGEADDLGLLAHAAALLVMLEGDER